MPAVLDRLRGLPEHPRQRPRGPLPEPAHADAAADSRGDRRADRRGCAMNVTCFTDAVDPGAPRRRGGASRRRRRVGGDRRQAGGAEHRRRHRRGRAATPARSSSSIGHSTDGTPDVAAAKRRDACCRMAARKGRGDPPRHPAHPHAGHRVPRRRRLARSGGHPAAGRADPCRSGRPRLRVAAAGRIERAARRVRRVLPAHRQLVHHRVHQLALQLPAERQPERLPRDPDVACCGSSTCARTRRRSSRR